MPGRHALEALLLIPLAASYLVIGLGIAVTWGALFPKSLLLVTAGHAIRNLPLAFAVLSSSTQPRPGSRPRRAIWVPANGRSSPA